MTSADLRSAETAVLADDIEARAYADIFDAAPSALRSMLALQVAQVAGTTLLIAPRMPATIFNRAIGLGLVAPATSDAIAAIVQAYRTAGAHDWWIHVNPFARPEDLQQRLSSAGFTVPARRVWAKMVRGVRPPSPIETSLQIGAATDDRIGRVASAIAQSFEMPPFMADWIAALHDRPRWSVYEVSDGDQIVGGGCLFVDGDCAWLGLGSVIGSHRRRGGQGNLMNRRISDSIAAGVRLIVTETGEAVADEPNPSLDNMYRCGFVKVASRLNMAARDKVEFSRP